MEIAEMELEVELERGERSEERRASKTASEATRTSAKVECVREGGAGPKRMEEQQPGERSY
jgi:hypothetical protein